MGDLRARFRLTVCCWTVMGGLGGSTHAQTVVLEDDFDGRDVDTRRWTVEGAPPEEKAVTLENGRLHMTARAAGLPAPGELRLLSAPRGAPLFERPGDDTEYDVYFLGVRIPDRPQRFALGLYSPAADGREPKGPAKRSDQDCLSYCFRIDPNRESPRANWVSTATVGAAGAAADSTGPEGFHTWEYGKVYDFRIQVTRHDVNWLGRVHPHPDWMLLQDPVLVIGYDGDEPGGRNRFGVFVSASPGGAENGQTWADADVQVDRIRVTRYRPVVLETLVECRFRESAPDESFWTLVVPEAGTDRIESVKGQPLRIVSAGEGEGWAGAAGLYTRPDRFPLFVRPSDPARRVCVDFLGVGLPSRPQRCALGLYSVQPGPSPSPPPRFPSDLGPAGGLAYAFWVLPDNDRLVENSNQLRAAVIGEKYAATDNYHHAWVWPYTEKRDLRLVVTAEDVQWYLRKDSATAWRVLRDDTEFMYRRPAVPEDRNTGYWRPLYDPAIRTGRPFDGTEPNGRNAFGVFVHVSAAGRDGQIAWEDGDVRVDGIRVTVVANEDGRPPEARGTR